MMVQSYDYMDEILARKTAQPAAETFLSKHLTPLWHKLKLQLDADIKVWNLKCERYDIPNSKVFFYGNPAPVVVENAPADRKKSWSSPLAELEFSSVYAETFARTFLGLPKKRIYLWMTNSENPRILFNYGTACSYNSASALDVKLADGSLLLGEGLTEAEFLVKTARELLEPLFEVR